MGEIKQRPFAEVGLLSVLHFHNEMLTRFGRAIDVVNHATVAHEFGQQFLVQKRDIPDLLFVYKQVVQKVDQQVFADFLFENPLKPRVGKGVDKAWHKLVFLPYRDSTSF